jgi:4-amino-4-deoxy-L-arabinose transferase-like glycosyltransferase
MATEQSIQNAVWQIELGRGKKIIQWTAATLFILFFGLVWYPAVRFNGLDKRESMDMAQLARNVSRGQNYTTYFIRPLSLWQLKTHRGDHDQRLMNHPDLYNPPLYPLVLASLFKLMPKSMFNLQMSDRVYAPERWVILPFNQLCVMLSLLLIYFWTKQMFDKRVAITAGWLLMLSDTIWSYGVSGLPTSLLMLLVLLAMYCLFIAEQRLHPGETIETGNQPVDRPPPTGPLSAGVIGLVLLSAVLMGLCFLTRYLSAFLVVPMAIYAGSVMRGRRPAFWVLVYVAVVLVVIAPWLLRNQHVSGSLLGIAQYQMGGDEKMQRSYHPDLTDIYGLRHLSVQFLPRARTVLTVSLKEIGSGYLVFFFGVGLMYGFRRRDVSGLRLAVLGGLLAGALGMALIGSPTEQNNPDVNGGNLLVLFLPLVAVFGVAFFYLLLDRIAFSIKLTRAAAIAVFALLNVAPVIFTLLPPRKTAFAYPPYLPPGTLMVANWFDKNEVGMSDLPWAMAWYGDRRTVWLPTTVDEFYEIHDFVAPRGISFIMLTPYMLNQPFQTEITRGQYKGWANVIRGDLPANFPLKEGTLLPPENEQVIFADRPRWNLKQMQQLEGPKKQAPAPAPSNLAPPPPPAGSTAPPGTMGVKP